MKKPCSRHHEEIGCNIIAKYFDIFQQFIDANVALVLIPFFHILFLRFIKQLQADHGSYYGVTDFSEYKISLTYHREIAHLIHSFVLKGRIVNIEAGYKSMDKRANVGSPFVMVYCFNISCNQREVLVVMRDYFMEFLEQQNFEEIKKEASGIISIDPRAKYIGNEIEKFYLGQ